LPHEPATHVSKVRIVNVRTGNSVDLGETRVVVGRDDACNVVLPGMGVSRRHCSIAPVQGGYLLRDESANGTLVNGSRISGTYLLDHGDIIRVCDEELRFEVEGAAAPAPTTTAAPTAILDLSRLRSEHAAAETQEWPGAPLVAFLEIVRGPFAGASFLIDRPVCSIGRSAENDVRIRDESISANHVTLLRKGTTWFVVDLRSANGTFVDGSRIAGERALTSGSRLKLGRVELAFRAVEGGLEPANAKGRARAWPLELVTSLFSRKSRALESA
jgi:pSer/pThr/pTyr-binding forkhead associated (FHA) protein